MSSPRPLGADSRLPLPEDAPLDFRMQPEFLFDNIVEYYEFLSRYDPDALDNGDKDTLITFAITFLAPTYLKNPFLKAKLVAVGYCLTLLTQDTLQWSVPRRVPPTGTSVRPP